MLRKGLLWLHRATQGHTGSYRTTRGPHRTTQSYGGPHRATQGHIVSYGTTQDHMGPHRTQNLSQDRFFLTLTLRSLCLSFLLWGFHGARIP